jgi:hypothetical protein
MMMPALRGITAPYVELVNPRGFVIVDKHQLLSQFRMVSIEDGMTDAKWLPAFF